MFSLKPRMFRLTGAEQANSHTVDKLLHNFIGELRQQLSQQETAATLHRLFSRISKQHFEPYIGVK